MKILAIETSCDETALALVEASGGLSAPKFKVLENLVSSQIEIHRPFGGVVPNLAKREHLKNLPLVFQQMVEAESKMKPDLLAVTVGPGLEPALWAGIGFAKEIKAKFFSSASRRIPLIGTNHLEGHLYSFLLPKTLGERAYKTKGLKFIFPAIALIVSGGHTILLKMESLTKWKKLGETVDDAVGEAFDKVAKMMYLPYPGGPEISRLAKTGNRTAIDFPRPMLHSKDYNFSYSGLKTSVLYFLNNNRERIVWDTSVSKVGHKIREQGASASQAPRRKASRVASSGLAKRDFDARGLASEQIILPDVAASFEEAAVDVLVKKTMRAAKEFSARSILLSGGVAANTHLRKMLAQEAKTAKHAFLVPPITFNTDNATMIAAAAYISYLRKKNRPLRANGSMSI